MFLVRLFLGLLKGIVVGGLVGWGLAATGLAAPAFAYVAAALVGILVAMVAGKPVWAKDARIQIYLKMAAGALLGPGLLFLTRKFLTIGLPFETSLLPGVAAAPGVSIGMFAVTSLALVGAVLAGFYDADNSAEDGNSSAQGDATNQGAQSSKNTTAAKRAASKPAAGKQRIANEIAAITGLDPSEFEAVEAERARSRK